MILSGCSKYASTAGEDSDFSNHSHTTELAPDVSSFGVFDGHFGNGASRTCAKHLNPAIVNRFSSLRSKSDALVGQLSTMRLEHHDELIGFLTSEEWMDMLMSEAIRAISKIMDSEIQRVDKSGTSAVSLFAREKIDGSGTIRVILSNIGDSRCVAFGPKESVMHLRALASGPDAGIDDARSKVVSKANMLNEVTHFLKAFTAQEALPIPLEPIASTKDHTLENPEERKRINDGFEAKVKWDLSPFEVLSKLALASLSMEADLSERGLSSRRGHDHDHRPIALIVDGSNLSRTFTVNCVRKLGFDVEEADNWRQACKILRAAAAVGHAFSLVIVDEVVDEIRSLRDCGIADIKDTPVILISEEDSSPPHPSSVVIRKPLQQSALKAALGNLGLLQDNSESFEVSTNDESHIGSPGKQPILPLSMSPGTATFGLDDELLEGALNKEIKISSLSIEMYLSSIASVLDLIHKHPVTKKSDRKKLAMLTLAFLCPEQGYSACDADVSSSLSDGLYVSSFVTSGICDVAFGDRKKGYTITRENSFIGKKQPKETGVEMDVIFGRFNDISIPMTRSIGGRYCPRRCIPLPDLIALDVKPGEFLRCVLASDGLWDVVSVQKVALVINRYEDPKDAAEALVNKSLRRRTEKNLGSDDITVLVVDIDKTSGSTKAKARSSISGSGKQFSSSLKTTTAPSSSAKTDNQQQSSSREQTVFKLQGEVVESEPANKSNDGCNIS